MQTKYSNQLKDIDDNETLLRTFLLYITSGIGLSLKI
jgi:hypothetical protein